MDHTSGAVIASIGLCLSATYQRGPIVVGFLADMEITRVKIGLCDDDERIKAYATITIDDCFVIQGLRLTYSPKKAIFFLCRVEKWMTVHTWILCIHLTTKHAR